MEKKLIRFRSMTTLLWPISQRVRISPRTSYDQKLAHAEKSLLNIWTSGSKLEYNLDHSDVVKKNLNFQGQKSAEFFS